MIMNKRSTQEFGFLNLSIRRLFFEAMLHPVVPLTIL